MFWSKSNKIIILYMYLLPKLYTINAICRLNKGICMLVEVVNATLIILFVELFCVRVQLMSNGD